MDISIIEASHRIIELNSEIGKIKVNKNFHSFMLKGFSLMTLATTGVIVTNPSAFLISCIGIESALIGYNSYRYYNEHKKINELENEKEKILSKNQLYYKVN